MIVLTNTSDQALAPGQSVTFNQVVLKTGCAEYFRLGSSSVCLRASGIYDIRFGANVGGAAGVPVQLQIEIGGSPIADSIMISTPSAEGDLNNVAKDIPIKSACGCPENVTVTNTGTEAITIGAYPSLYISRIC